MKLALGENSPCLVGATSQFKGGVHFWKDGECWVGCIIQGDSSAGHCFVLRV